MPDEDKVKGKTDDELENLAVEYGWSVAFFRSVPELWRLFKRAINKEWEPALFVAKLRATKWYQNNAESVRKYQVLKTSKGDFQAALQEKMATIQDLSVELTGVYLSSGQLKRVADQALMFNWNDSQLRNILSGYLKQVGGSKGHYGGEAGQAEEELRQYAYDMGVNLSDPTVKKWLKAIVAKNNTIQDYKAYIQGQAESQFQGLSKEIRAGQTVRQLANPYLEQMASTLELNPAAIDLKNPTLLKALQIRNKDGSVGMQSLGDFRLQLMQDPRYLGTKEARDKSTDVGQAILKDFGLI
jgi:hypothetical protein